MLRYIINRVLIAIPVLILVMVITFTLGYYAPGDPVALIYNEQIAFMTPEQLEQIRHNLGLDKSYPEQAVDFITKIARGDLGTSIQTHQPVMTMIENGLPVTMQLALAAMVLLVVVGIPLGILAALRHNSWADYAIVGSILSLRTIPIFVLGPILILIFVLNLGWLDLPLGWDGLFNTKVILPVLLLTAAPLADVVRQTRVSVLEVLLVVAGIPLGILAALRHNSWADYAIVGSILSLRTIPIFVLGPILILIFVLNLGWLDLPLGWDGLFNTKVILPVLLLTAAPLADVVRQTRVSVLEVLSQDYIRTAHAKGLKVHMVVTRHILRNALIPVVTSLGLIVNSLVHGSVFLERLFTLPGFGNLVVTSIQVLDFPVIMGTTIFSALIVVAANLITDFLYPFIDPRVRLE